MTLVSTLEDIYLISIIVLASFVAGIKLILNPEKSLYKFII